MLAALLATAVWALVVATQSPLLAYREPVYVAGGIAGVLALVFLLFQPLLAAGVLPGINGRRVHRVVGIGLLVAIVVHVGGLWITSPPDVVDALLFRSPTPFSAWGVIAMWALLAAAALATLRRKIAFQTWQRAHTGSAAVVVLGTVAHAMLIEGTMGQTSKLVLCVGVLVANGVVLNAVWRRLRRG